MSETNNKEHIDDGLKMLSDLIDEYRELLISDPEQFEEKVKKNSNTSTAIPRV